MAIGYYKILDEKGAQIHTETRAAINDGEKLIFVFRTERTFQIKAIIPGKKRGNFTTRIVSPIYRMEAGEIGKAAAMELEKRIIEAGGKMEPGDFIRTLEAHLRGPVWVDEIRR